MSTYLQADKQGKIPTPQTFWGEFVKFARFQIQVRGGIINALLFIDEDGNINYRMCFMLYSLPVVTIYTLYNMINTALADHREAS